MLVQFFCVLLHEKDVWVDALQSSEEPRLLLFFVEEGQFEERPHLDDVFVVVIVLSLIELLDSETILKESLLHECVV